MQKLYSLFTFDLETTLSAGYLDSFTWKVKEIYHKDIAIPSHFLNSP